MSASVLLQGALGRLQCVQICLTLTTLRATSTAADGEFAADMAACSTWNSSGPELPHSFPVIEPGQRSP